MDDYISREAAKKAVCERCDYAGTRECVSCVNPAEAIPAADVRPVVRGRWIWDDEGYHCSECWHHAYGNTGEILSGDYHYCPSCGADMREVDI